MAFSFNRNWDVHRVVRKLVYTILGLFVGGTVLTTFGTVMKFTESPFYNGLNLIGWTVGAFPKWNTTHYAAQCANTSVAPTTAVSTATNCITSVDGAGVLSVVGILSIASVVLEFVTWR